MHCLDIHMYKIYTYMGFLQLGQFISISFNKTSFAVCARHFRIPCTCQWQVTISVFLSNRANTERRLIFKIFSQCNVSVWEYVVTFMSYISCVGTVYLKHRSESFVVHWVIRRERSHKGRKSSGQGQSVAWPGQLLHTISCCVHICYLKPRGLNYIL